MGVSIKNIDISLGEVSVDLNDDLISKKKKSLDTHDDEPVQSTTTTTDSDIAKKQQKKQATFVTITKYTSLFPEKVRDYFLHALWTKRVFG